MRVAFLHLALGIGGAERLVVDAALALGAAGHEVTIFTTRHDPERSFEATRDGCVRVRVLGAALPSHTGRFLRAPFAIARMAYLSVRAALGERAFDAVVCDGVAHTIPLWRLAASTPIVFYCNFPDLMLAPDGGRLYRAYREPIDRLEAAGVARADRVLVNSRYTAEAFGRAFPRAGEPEVVYPGVDVGAYAGVGPAPEDGEISVVSIARYERAKAVTLAVDALALLRDRVDAATYDRVRLVVAGGYDERSAENVRTYAEIDARVRALGLEGRVRLLRSIDDEERVELIGRSRFVVYTPPAEHFGLVPVEAMAAGRPVVAARGGGPAETIVDGETGLLCESSAGAYADAFARLVERPEEAARMGEAGRRRVAGAFSREAFGARLESVLAEVARVTARRKP